MGGRRLGGRAVSEPDIRGDAGTGAGARGGTIRLGIMGGTFDPIHIGHLAIAEAAREALGLAQVVFVPAGEPPHKPDSVDASVEDRVEMVRLAIADNPAFALSRVDVDRAGPSYTADSVRLIGDEERAAGREPDLVLVMSSETLAGLRSWHDPARLVAAAGIAVVPREGHPAPDPAWIEASFPGQAGRFTIVDGPRLGISSTAIRAAVAAGRSIRYLVPEAVGAYIADHGLYRSAPQSRNPTP
jgi:nicotinate-nucleotide adenylyltransferase